MKSKITMGVRLLLGAILLVFGINKFANFMPMPLEGEALTYFNALAEQGVLKVVGIVEIIVGLLLLIGKYVPLALLLFAPIAVNIIMFHLAVDPKGIAAGAFVTIATIYLMFQYKSKFDSVLEA